MPCPGWTPIVTTTSRVTDKQAVSINARLLSSALAYDSWLTLSLYLMAGHSHVYELISRVRLS